MRVVKMRRKRQSPTKRVSECWSRGLDTRKNFERFIFCSLFRKITHRDWWSSTVCVNWWYHWFFIQLQLPLVKAPYHWSFLDLEISHESRFPHAFSSPVLVSVDESKQRLFVSWNRVVLLPEFDSYSLLLDWTVFSYNLCAFFPEGLQISAIPSSCSWSWKLSKFVR